MGFFEGLAEDADEFLEDLDQETVYHPLGGDGSTVRCAWARVDLMAMSHDDGRESGLRGVVQVHADDAPSPSDRDTFELEGGTWAVERVEATKPLAVFHVFRIDQRRWGGVDNHAKR